MNHPKHGLFEQVMTWFIMSVSAAVTTVTSQSDIIGQFSTYDPSIEICTSFSITVTTLSFLSTVIIDVVDTQSSWASISTTKTLSTESFYSSQLHPPTIVALMFVLVSSRSSHVELTIY
jgi:hypothetical protein